MVVGRAARARPCHPTAVCMWRLRHSTQVEAGWRRDSCAMESAAAAQRRDNAVGRLHTNAGRSVPQQRIYRPLEQPPKAQPKQPTKQLGTRLAHGLERGWHQLAPQQGPQK